MANIEPDKRRSNQREEVDAIEKEIKNVRSILEHCTDSKHAKNILNRLRIAEARMDKIRLEIIEELEGMKDAQQR